MSDGERNGGSRSTMRAAVVTGPGAVEIRDVPLPEPGPGQVRVRLEGSGVCASNLTPWEGPEWMQFPTAPGDLGHEGWGVVDAVGEDVRHLKPGDRVATLGTNAYAEFDLAGASAVARIPDELSAVDFPGEPFGCAMNIFRRSDIRAGQTAAVIGIGFLGAILVRLASRAGARVIAISRRQSSLELAREMGAAETIAMDDHQAIIDHVAHLTAGKFCDRVIEAVGKQWPLDLAGELVGFGGRLVIAGYHQDGPRQVNMQGWNWKGIDVVNAHERDPLVQLRGVREAVTAVTEGRINLASLLTHRYPLERLGEALDATRDKPHGFVKAWIDLS